MKLLRKRLLIAPIAIWAFTFTYCFSSTVMARQSSGLATLGSLIMMGPGPEYSDGCTTKKDANNRPIDNSCQATEKCASGDVNDTRGCSLHYGTGNHENELFCDCGTGEAPKKSAPILGGGISEY
jgi:hypothetical protein